MINARYEIIKKLGEGRSSVFLCNDIEIPNERFAIKILPATADNHEKEIFVKEYFALQKLEHPNIIKSYELGVVLKTDGEDGIETGSTFIILEYFEGVELLSSDKIRNEQLVKEIMKQLCAALYYLHQSKYIYYDLKPDNILISIKDKSAQIKLIDLGLAEYSASQSDYEIKGTAHYIAPELLKKEKHNHSVDLYSLGMILYQIIYKRFPFEAKAELDIYKYAIEDEFKFPEIKNYSKEIISVAKRLLAKDVNTRYSSALEVINNLGFPFDLELTKEFLPAKTFSCRDSVIKQLSDYINNESSTEIFTIKGFEGVGKSALLFKIHELFNHSVVISDVRGKSAEELTRFILRQIVFSPIVYQNLSENNKKLLLDKLKLTPKELIAEFKSSISKIASDTKLVLLIDDFNLYDKLVINLLLDVIPILQVNNSKIILVESSEHEFVSNSINNLKEIILSPFTVPELKTFLDESYYDDFPRESLRNLVVKNADLIPGNIKSFIKDLILFGIMKFSEKGVSFNDDEQKLSSITEAHFAVYDLRLANLSKRELIAAKVISAFNIYLDPSILSQILGLDKSEVEKIILKLQTNNILQNFIAGQSLVFTSEAIKNYIYASIEDKKKFHYNIASHITKKLSSFNRIETARHYELADEFDVCYKITMEEIIESEKHSTFSYMQKVLDHLVKLPLKKELLKSAKIKLSEVYYKLGDMQSCLNLIKELKNEKPQIKIVDKLFIIEGSALIASGEYEAGKRLISNLLKQINDFNEQSRLKVELAYADFELRKYVDANRQCDEILKDDKISAELKGRCYNLKGMINIYENNDLNSALENFQKAKDKFIDANQPIRISGAEVNIGNIQNIFGNYKQAEEHLQNASRINQSIGNLEQEGLLMQNMGAFYFYRNNIESAIKSYQKGYNIFLSLGNELNRAIVLWDLGEIYISTCEYDNALNSLNEAESIFIRLQNHTELLDNLFMKGKLFYKIGEFQKLEQVNNSFHTNLVKYNLSQSHEVLEKLLIQFNSAGRKQSLSITDLELIREEMIKRKDSHNYLEVISLIIQYYFYQKSFHDAIDELNRSELIELCSQNSILEAHREYFLGIISKKIKSDSLLPPLMYFEKAYEIIKDMHINELTWKVLFEISELYIDRGNLTKAKYYITYTRELIYFIAEKIKSPQMRATYLRNRERLETLKKLESFYPSI